MVGSTSVKAAIILPHILNSSITGGENIILEEFYSYNMQEKDSIGLAK